MLGNIVQITKRTSCDTVRALEDLLQQARAGYVRGIIFACEYGPTEHEIGATGTYRHNTFVAVGAAMRLVDGLRLLDSAS